MNHSNDDQSGNKDHTGGKPLKVNVLFSQAPDSKERLRKLASLLFSGLGQESRNSQASVGEQMDEESNGTSDIS